MKKSFYLIVAIAFLSCSQSNKKQSTNKKIQESKYKTLLAKYKEKTFDTLHVYSPEDSSDQYEGVALDSADAVLFPADIAPQYSQEDPELFAIYKFSIDLGPSRVSLAGLCGWQGTRRQYCQPGWVRSISSNSL